MSEAATMHETQPIFQTGPVAATMPAQSPQPAAEQPQYPKGYFTRFTRDNAREMARRGNETLQAIRDAAKNSQQPTANTVKEPANPELEHRVRVVKQMIEQTERAYKATDSPKEMQSLATALDKLYQTWSLLTGHEKPGVRKSSSKPSKARPAYQNMPEPDPTPSQT